MKKLFLILLMLIALSLFLSCAKKNYAEKINPLLDKYIEAFAKIWDNLDEVLEVEIFPDEIYLRSC